MFLFANDIALVIIVGTIILVGAVLFVLYAFIYGAVDKARVEKRTEKGNKQKKNRQIINEISQMVEPDIMFLYHSYLQLGSPDFLDIFINKHYDTEKYMPNAIEHVIQQRFRKIINSVPVVTDYLPSEFEMFVAERMNQKGFKAQATKGSGDFGADIIAEDKYGNKIVIQVKKNQNKVGPKAVQEVFAAKQYFEAEEAWIVTNSSYTNAALELANSTNVRLLHYSEI